MTNIDIQTHITDTDTHIQSGEKNEMAQKYIKFTVPPLYLVNEKYAEHHDKNENYAKNHDKKMEHMLKTVFVPLIALT